MKVALIGVTGNVGSRLADELSNRGHDVTGIARNVAATRERPGLSVAEADANDGAALSAVLSGHDAVILSGTFSSTNPATILDAVKSAGAPRLLVVGGAGTLEVAPGVQLVDTPDFPAEFKPEVLAGRNFLDALRASDADWTFLSPPLFFEPGQRTAQYRLGLDQLMFTEAGDSRISYEDYAKALVDELEVPSHSRRRFSIAY